MNTKSVFLSYAWKNKDAVDQLDEALHRFELDITRDTRDLDYLENINAFMQSISNHDHAILVISRSYLESKNCMYEALELLENNSCDKKIVPIYTEDCKIFSAKDRLIYLNYWETLFEEVNQEIKKLSTVSHIHEILKELEQYRKIRDKIDPFLCKVSSIKGFGMSELKDHDYEPLIKSLGIAKIHSTASEDKNVEPKKSFSLPFVSRLWGNDFGTKDLSALYLALLESWRLEHNKKLGIDSFVNICERLSVIFSKKSKNECRASIKILLKSEDDLKVQTLARSFGGANRKEILLNALDNSAYQIILNEMYHDIYFLSNDLSSEHNYINANSDWKNLYKSVLVVPILDEVKKSKYYVSGFITLDSFRKNTFKDYENIEFLQGVAKYLHYPIIAYGETIIGNEKA